MADAPSLASTHNKKRKFGQLGPDAGSSPAATLDPSGPAAKRARGSEKAQDQYELAKDASLTDRQEVRGRFSTERDFRDASNLTLYGYKTGYHESAVTTDTYIFLKGATASGNGMMRLPPASRAPALFRRSGLAGALVDTRALAVVIDVADGFRTDTAQTVLSAPEGAVAAHAGSRMSLKRQAAAHDLLRKAVGDILSTDPDAEDGWSAEAVATAFGAITVASMAPGELARQIPTEPMKAEQAKFEWEVCRNEAKSRIQAAYEALSLPGQAFVRKHAQAYLDSTNEGGDERYLAEWRPTTPLRDVDDLRPGEVAGGAYNERLKMRAPTVGLPRAASDYGFYFTQPFRTRRRVLRPTLM